MELWTRTGSLEGASCSRRLSNKPTSVALFAGDTKCFRAIKIKVTMTTFASGVIYGKSILTNPSAGSLGHRRN